MAEQNEPEKTKTRRTVQSKEFRTFAVSSIGLSMNDNFAHVTLGLEISDPGSDEEIIQEEVRAVMTPRTLKVFSIVLGQAVAAFEAATGKIPIPPGKEEELGKLIKVWSKK